jgi:gliding motility-associated-like protein
LLVSGIGDADNGMFRIANDDLILVNALNFENASSLSIRLQTMDSNNATFEKVFTIKIADEAEAPTDIILSSNAFDENLDLGSSIINFSSVDEDNNEQFTYELVNGSGSSNNDLFIISGSTLQTNSEFDFEDEDEYYIRIKTTDKDNLSLELEFELLVNDQNDAPIGTNQQFTLPENEVIGSIIGQLNFSDEDANEVLTYELLENADLFGVSSSTGDLFVLNNLNFESDQTIVLEAQVTDSDGEKAQSEITIYIENAIDDKLPVAKIFSPNGDGMNDTWKISNVESYSNYKLIIFTSSGEIVYEVAADYNNDWRGDYNGINLPEGVYYYFFQNNDNSNKVFKGSITLKR